MAHKTEKEETEFKVLETITLCVNNCGVIANPSTNNMCQNCFKATTTITSSSGGGGGGGGPSKVSKLSTDNTPRSSIHRLDSSPTTTSSSDRISDQPDLPPPTTATVKRVVNRCSGCKRKVGLTGFRCRCGDLFCSEHRYSDRHDCTYDYKAAARVAIARDNPVVKAAKIVRV
ncbi:hypothetical protein ACFE04_004404 [Oxalis oulophora]